nr:DBP [Darna trima granulovirus]
MNINSNSQLVAVKSITINHKEDENTKWDYKLLKRLNSNFKEAEKKIKCTTNDYYNNIIPLSKYYQINDLSKHIYYDDSYNVYNYDDNKLQIYKLESGEKITYLFGFKTLTKPKLTYIWDKGQLKMGTGKHGKFFKMSIDNEMSIINVMEQVMGNYLKANQIQCEPIPVTIDDGLLLDKPEQATEKEKFMSKFFILNYNDNIKNIEENDIVEPFMIKRMPLTIFEKLFEIPQSQHFSESRPFIICTVFNGVHEKIKKMQRSMSLWMTPLIFIYVNE